MTITTTDRKAGPFLGDGVTTQFPFAFKVFDKAHLRVLRTNTAGAEEVVGAYTVTLNADQENNPGGFITLSSPLAEGETLTIVTDEPFVQLAELNNMGGFFPKTIENCLDYLTVLAQLWRQTFSRAMLTARSDRDVNLSLGTAAMRANRFLAFDAQGNVTFPTGISSSPANGVVHFEGVGDGLTDVTAELQAAINSTAGSAALHIPAGTYLVSATLRIPSNSHIYGDGMGVTIIKMAGHVGRRTPLVQTGVAGDPRQNIVIRDLTLDANADRASVDGGTPLSSSSGTALAIVNSSHVVVQRVAALNATGGHGIDVSAPSYGTNDPTYYDPEPSRFVWILDCYARNNGDDNITTHQCSDVWIVNCHSEFPGGHAVPGNTNCVEIDDGSRNVFVRDCVGIGGICGLQIKGHNNRPAPYNVVVDGFRAINNYVGVEIRHTGWYTTTDEDLADETVDEDGNPFVYTGASPNARNLILNNIQVIAPRNVTGYGPQDVAAYGFRLRSYENVIINNLLLTDGTLGADGDYEPFNGFVEGGYICRIYSGARHVQIRNMMIYGFPNVATPAVRFTSSLAGPLFIDGLTAINGPANIVNASTGAGPVYIDRYYILGDHPTAEEPIWLAGANKRIGQGVISGYGTRSPHVTLAVAHAEYRRRARSTNDVTAQPADFIRMVWEEATQNLGMHEGMRIAGYCNLRSNAAGEEYNGVDYEFGSFGFRKESANDTQAMHSFFLQLIAATDGSPPRDVLVVRADGGVHFPEGLPEFSDDSAAAAGGIAVGQLYRTGSTVKIRVS